MKVATWNVNGIRARWGDVTAWADRFAPDIFCLQEIKATPSQIPEPLTGLPTYVNHWHGAPGGYSGVSLHVRRGLQQAAPKFSSPPFDEETRFVEVELDDDLVVASVYVHNGQKDLQTKLRFLRALGAWVDQRLSAGKRLLVCGDLNVARSANDLHEKQRKRGAVGQTVEERKLIEAILAHGLCDIIRTLNPDRDDLFTWWPPWREEKQKNRGWRIDYVLASEHFDATSCQVLKEEGSSDHAPVVVELTESRTS